MGKTFAYGVQFKFTNTSNKTAATNVNFTHTWPEGFVEDKAKSTCNGLNGTLNAGDSCVIEGSFQTSTSGYYQIQYHLHYNEGSAVTVSSAGSTFYDRAYMGTSVDGGKHITVSFCTLDATGLFQNCKDSDAGEISPRRITFNPSRSKAFIADISCHHDLATGALSPCSYRHIGNPSDILFTVDGMKVFTNAYHLLRCDVNQSLDVLTNCQSIKEAQLDNISTFTFNSSKNKMYIIYQNNKVISCNIDQATGVLSDCKKMEAIITGDNPIYTMIFNEMDTKVLMSTFDDSIVKCDVGHAGDFENCAELRHLNRTTLITEMDYALEKNQIFMVAAPENIERCDIDPATALISHCINLDAIKEATQIYNMTII